MGREGVTDRFGQRILFVRVIVLNPSLKSSCTGEENMILQYHIKSTGDRG